MLVILLFGCMLAVMLMRVFLPLGQRTAGTERAVFALGLKERLLYQRTNIYAIGAVLVLTALTGLISVPIELVVFAAVLAILMIPVRYRLTDQGIGLNNVVFRRWDEFEDLDIGGRSVRLLGKEGAADFTVRALP